MWLQIYRSEDAATRPAGSAILGYLSLLSDELPQRRGPSSRLFDVASGPFPSFGPNLANGWQLAELTLQASE